MPNHVTSRCIITGPADEVGEAAQPLDDVLGQPGDQPCPAVGCLVGHVRHLLVPGACARSVARRGAVRR